MARYPPQIYWRRRALALGIAVLVIGVIAAVVIMIVSNSAGAETKNADKPDSRPPRPTPLPGENPEVKTPVIPPAEASPAADPHPDRGRHAAAGAQGGRRLPRFDVGRQGHHQRAEVRHRRPAEVHHGRHQYRAGGLPARCRRRGAGRLRLLAGQHPAVVEPGLRAVERDAGQDVQPRRAGDHRGDVDGHGLGPGLPAAASADRAGHLQPGRPAGQPALGRGSVHPRRAAPAEPAPAPAEGEPPAEGAPPPGDPPGPRRCRRSGQPVGDRRLGQHGQAFPDVAGPHRPDTLDRLQVVRAGGQQPLQ